VPPHGVPRRNFGKMFGADKTRMIGLPYGEETMISRFHPIPEHYGRTDRQTDRQTDGRTDIISTSTSRLSVLTRDKNVINEKKQPVVLTTWITL